MNVKRRIKSFTIHTIENTCGTSHLLLSFATDSVEWVEKKLINKLEPDLAPEDILSKRRGCTVRTKHQIRQELARIKRDIQDLGNCDMSEADDVMNETETFGQ